jgi:hypothetical protein
METTPWGVKLGFQRGDSLFLHTTVAYILPCSEANNALVWKETSRIVGEWFSAIDITVGVIQKFSVPVLLVPDLTQVSTSCL